MARIVLLSCVSKKQNHKSKAKDLYLSPLFKKSLRYAEFLNPDRIFVLSAKYGLVELDEEVEPYDKTLNKMSSDEKIDWANMVLGQLDKVVSVGKDTFIFLAGNNYRKFLLPHIKYYEIPMEGLGIGKQLQWLTEGVKNE